MQEKYHSKARMLLHLWLKTNKISVAKFSRQLDIDYSIMAKWLHGYTLPSLQNALHVQEATNGDVKCTDWTLSRTKKNNKKSSPNQQKSTNTNNDSQNLENHLKSS